MGPKSNDWCPSKKREEIINTKMQGRRLCEDGREFGVMLPHAREHQELPEAGREKMLS